MGNGNVRLCAGILAGGRSTRMGSNKAFLEWKGRSFIERIAQELSGFSGTILSAAEKGVYEELGLPVVYDVHCGIGPMEGIYRVLENAAGEYVFICAADMPFLKKELVFYMAEFISSDYDCFCLADEEHVHPLCAIYSKRVLPVIETLIAKGEYRLTGILDGVRTKYIRLEYTCFDKKTVRNINTREEYQRLILPIVFCVSGVKNSGKTELITKLIAAFRREKYSVAVIKHDGHDYVMDYEGTDTYRFREAGAVCSGIFSHTQHSVNYRTGTCMEEMLRLCGDTDIVILEGLKDSDIPKLEVVRGEISRRSVCKSGTLIGIATDVVNQNEVSCPVLELNDTDGIYACIKKYFGLEQ